MGGTIYLFICIYVQWDSGQPLLASEQHVQVPHVGWGTALAAMHHDVRVLAQSVDF